MGLRSESPTEFCLVKIKLRTTLFRCSALRKYLQLPCYNIITPLMDNRLDRQLEA